MIESQCTSSKISKSRNSNKGAHFKTQPCIKKKKREMSYKNRVTGLENGSVKETSKANYVYVLCD